MNALAEQCVMFLKRVPELDMLNNIFTTNKTSKQSLDWNSLTNTFVLGFDGKMSYFLVKKLIWTDQMVFAISVLTCEKRNLFFFRNYNLEAVL